jgi:putative molybdopterin biosynthesis protein
VIRAKAGLPPEAAVTVDATLPVRIPSELGRKEFVLVALVAGADGPIAFPIGKGSGSVTTFSQADGFLEVDALRSSVDAGASMKVTRIGPARAPGLVIAGSHCVALDAVLSALSRQGVAARTIAIGSMGGVAAARRGECDLAPIHLMDPATGRYNAHFATDGLALVRGWQRMQGIVFRKGDARFEGKTAQDAVAAARAEADCIMVNRNAGAGTRILIDQLLGSARPAGYGNQPRSHNAVAAAVAQGRADWGVAIRPVAAMYGLGFLELAPENYDFLLVEARRARAPVAAFLAALADPDARAQIVALGMTPV